MFSPAVFGDWRTECGWEDLAAYCGEAGLPDGGSTVVGQAEVLEGGFRYLPHSPGEGTGSEFGGKVFVDLTGISTVGTHARTVGRLFYGKVSSVAAGVRDVRCWAATDLYRKVLGVPGKEVAPVEVDILSAAFVSTGAYNAELRALDHGVNASGFLPVAATLNGSASPLPEALVCAYNGVSVGLTSGNHAAGPSPATVDGAGRVKPELVLPFGATSWATGGAASLAAVLRGAAPAGARRPEVLKALLLAGATKEEFPGWDRTPERPLDEVFGAGEANLYQSFRILEGGDCGPGFFAGCGWHLLAQEGAGCREWIFKVPRGMEGRELSVIATWNRQLEFVDGGYEPLPLADVNLELVESSAGCLQESRSGVDNVEHLYRRELGPGTYAVRVLADRAVEVAMAWRLDLVPGPRVAARSRTELRLGDLVPGRSYVIERSVDCAFWEEAATVTATEEMLDWSDPSPPVSGRCYYRLRYMLAP